MKSLKVLTPMHIKKSEHISLPEKNMLKKVNIKLVVHRLLRSRLVVTAEGLGGVVEMTYGGGWMVVVARKESEVAGWIDQKMGSIFGVAGKIPPENFSGGGPTAQAAGGFRHLVALKFVQSGTTPGPQSQQTIRTITMTNGDGMQRVKTLRETISPE
ncbi:hypothetical protein Tco_0247401 [Tanacetum coccineum]